MTNQQVYRLAKSLFRKHKIANYDFIICSFKTQLKKYKHQLPAWLHKTFTHSIAFHHADSHCILIDSDIFKYCSNKLIKKIILHEIAHALVQDNKNHSGKFKNICKQIGGIITKVKFDKRIN